MLKQTPETPLKTTQILVRYYSAHTKDRSRANEGRPAHSTTEQRTGQAKQANPSQATRERKPNQDFKLDAISARFQPWPSSGRLFIGDCRTQPVSCRPDLVNWQPARLCCAFRVAVAQVSTHTAAKPSSRSEEDTHLMRNNKSCEHAMNNGDEQRRRRRPPTRTRREGRGTR